MATASKGDVPASWAGGAPPPHRRDLSWAHASALVPPLRPTATRGDVVQIVKAVVAAVAAWLVAENLLGVASAFLAPWTALLTVHATVYRSFTRGAQVVGATVLGVLLSYLVVEAMGQGAPALAVALLLGMLAGTARPIHNEGSTVATTALFVITAGQAEQAPMLVDRLWATAVGVAAGLLCNVLLLAPIDDHRARRQVDAVARRLGHLLRDVSREPGTGEEVDARHWIERSRQTDAALGRAWELVRHTREARVGNPRKGPPDLGPGDYAAQLMQLEEGIAQARAIARTVEQSTATQHEWNAEFRQHWLQVLARLGERLIRPSEDEPSLRPELEDVVSALSRSSLPDDHWLTYGSLLDATLHVSDVVDDITSARQVRA